jgi:L-threonylcarbamoyladenylate synthase
MTEILRLRDTDPQAIAQRCAEVLGHGRLVILPTDTVYGLAARADITAAVRSVFTAKGRDARKALVIMVSSAAEAAELAAGEARDSLLSLGTLWPGPLTVVVKAKDLPWRQSVAPSTEMVGLRIPDSPLLLVLLGITGPLAVTSANPAGKPAPASFAEIDTGILAEAGLAVDGGDHGSGRPSTVVEIGKGGLKVLRQGDISEDDLRTALLRYGEKEETRPAVTRRNGGDAGC